MLQIPSNSRPILLHLLPEFQAGAPLAFIIDLSRQLTEFYHVLLTNRQPGDIAPKQDELCTKLGLDVRYTAQPRITTLSVEACRPDVVLAYDVRAADFEDLQLLDKFPTVYYGLYHYDSEIAKETSVRIAGSETRQQDPHDLYFPPYVDHSLVIDNAKKPHAPTRQRAIAILGGRPETFDFNTAKAAIKQLDRKSIALILPAFMQEDAEYDKLVSEARAERRVLLCPHIPGSTFNAYRRTQTLISTGCFRIDTECGALRRPVISPPDSIEELVETVNRSLTNRGLVDELIDYGRHLASQRQLSLHIHKFHNLVRRLY